MLFQPIKRCRQCHINFAGSSSPMFNTLAWENCQRFGKRHHWFSREMTMRRFPFTKKFRKFRLGCILNGTYFWAFHWKIPGNNWKIEKVEVLFSRWKLFRWKCTFHLRVFARNPQFQAIQGDICASIWNPGNESINEWNFTFFTRWTFPWKFPKVFNGLI